MELEILREPERVAVLADPARQRLIEELMSEPDSASGLARRLGEKRQRLNYHLRALEDAGLLEVIEERPRRGFMERVLRPVARRFVVDPSAFGGVSEGEPLDAGDRFSAERLVVLAARAIREIASLMRRAGREHKRLATISMNAQVVLAQPSDMARFADDLARAVAGVVQAHQSAAAGARPFRVLVGAWPARGEKNDHEREA